MIKIFLMFVFMIFINQNVYAQSCDCETFKYVRDRNFIYSNDFYSYNKVESSIFEYEIINIPEKYEFSRSYIDVFIEQDNFYKNSVPVINGYAPDIYLKKNDKNVIGFILDYSKKHDANRKFAKKDNYVIYKDIKLSASPIKISNPLPIKPTAVKPEIVVSKPTAVKAETNIEVIKPLNTIQLNTNDKIPSALKPSN